MPDLPWTTRAGMEPGPEYLVMASHLPLKRISSTVRFFRGVSAVRKQLAAADGLVGYTLRAKPLARDYWTLSVWTNETALRELVRTSPHVGLMASLKPFMGPTKFVTWTIHAADGHPSLARALERLASGSTGLHRLGERPFGRAPRGRADAAVATLRSLARPDEVTVIDDRGARYALHPAGMSGAGIALMHCTPGAWMCKASARSVLKFRVLRPDLPICGLREHDGDTHDARRSHVRDSLTGPVFLIGSGASGRQARSWPQAPARY